MIFHSTQGFKTDPRRSHRHLVNARADQRACSSARLLAPSSPPSGSAAPGSASLGSFPFVSPPPEQVRDGPPFTCTLNEWEETLVNGEREANVRKLSFAHMRGLLLLYREWCALSHRKSGTNASVRRASSGGSSETSGADYGSRTEFECTCLRIKSFAAEGRFLRY